MSDVSESCDALRAQLERKETELLSLTEKIEELMDEAREANRVRGRVGVRVNVRVQ